MTTHVFAAIAADMEFLVFENMPVDTIIDGPTLELLEERLDMGKNFVTVIVEGVEVQLGF